MNRTILTLLITLVFASSRATVWSRAAAEPSTHLSTAPTTSSSALPNASLAGGLIRFKAPEGDCQTVKSEDGRTQTFLLPDHVGIITLMVAPQEVRPPDEFKQQIALKMGRAIREQMQKEGREIVLSPKVEPDERFYLKVHDISRSGGKTADRVQILRIVGLNLMTVAATAWTDDTAKAADIHKIGEDVLMSARLGKPDAAGASGNGKKPAGAKPAKPSVFPKARIRVTSPPPQWTEDKSDTADGLVATYHDPDNETNLITVTVHPIPKETRKNPKARQIVIQDIIDNDKPTLQLQGAKMVGTPEVTEGAGFLRKTSSVYEASGQKFHVETRLVLAGDAVVSVTSLSAAESAEAVREMGDKLALGIVGMK